MERFLVAAVARIFEPGCTMQWMPILVGEQAIGKSRFLEMLTPEAPNGSGQHPGPPKSLSW
jgi:predicted P-loop ATPase